MFMAWQMFLYMLRHFKRKRWGRDTKLCAGNSLMGRLLLSLKERKVPTWLNTGVEELVFEDGKAVGAVLNKEGETLRVKANRGVVLAAGGFSRNLEMRQKYQRHPITTEWTAGTPSNTGDAIRMGRDAGSARPHGRSLVDAGVLGAAVTVLMGVGGGEEPAAWAVPQPRREAIHQ
jgi:3-oxosteroid 1-dehydrogenase